MGVEGERVGLLDPGQQPAAVGAEDGRGPEGAVDVEPQPLGPAHDGQVGQRVDAARAGRAEVATRQNGRRPAARSAATAAATMSGEPELVVAREQAHLVGLEAEQPGGPADQEWTWSEAYTTAPFQPVVQHRPPGRGQAVQAWPRSRRRRTARRRSPAGRTAPSQRRVASSAAAAPEALRCVPANTPNPEARASASMPT